MPDYLFLMHNDTMQTGTPQAWEAYLTGLRQAGCLQGGSAIGGGVCVRKAGVAPGPTQHLSGYIRIGAGNMDAARALLAGNPVFETGGTVEIRELPRTD